MIELYGHPFAAFAWKALIALYERDVPFTFRQVGPDQPANSTRLAELSPTGQFPVVVDGDYVVTQSNAVIEYCDLKPSDSPPMIPVEPLFAIEARELAEIFDDYVARPMQRIVGNALRGEADRSAANVAEAERTLARSYAWLDRWMRARDWPAAGRFTLADCAAAPALFYADWVYPIDPAYDALRSYRARLLAHPSVARVVDEARPYRDFFPLGAPDRD